MIEAQLPTLITVVLTAAVDSINPCAIGVLILMVTTIMAAGRSTRRLVFLGSLYIFAVFLTYLLAGLGLLYAFHNIPLIVTEYLSIFVAALLVLAGLIEIKDYFWYGRWFSLTIPKAAAAKMSLFASRTTVPGILFLGFFVSAVELPCTGAPYLAIITLLSQSFDFTAFLLLVLYNLIFVAPLIIILCLVAMGKQISDVHQWKQENRPAMRLAAGLLMVGLAWLLILIANGTVNFV